MLAVLAAGLLAACGKEAELPAADDAGSTVHVVLTAGEDEEEIFRIGPVTCSRAEAQLYLTNMQERYRSVYGDAILERSAEGQTFSDKLRQITLSRLVQVKTMLLMAEDRGITADDALRQKAKQAAEQYISGISGPAAGGDAFSQETVAACFEQMAVAELVYRQIIEETEPEISDDEARMVTVGQILLRTGETDETGHFTPYDSRQKQEILLKAQSLLARLQEGEDFDQVAAANNEADRITISFGKGEQEEAVDRAAFELGSEELSSVIETKEGYLILKCIKPFDRQQTDLRKEMIARQRKEEAFLQVYGDYTQGQIRTINERAFNGIDFPGTGQFSCTENLFAVFRDFFEEM
jgi:foldase protein PrsA